MQPPPVGRIQVRLGFVHPVGMPTSLRVPDPVPASCMESELRPVPRIRRGLVQDFQLPSVQSFRPRFVQEIPMSFRALAESVCGKLT